MSFFFTTHAHSGQMYCKAVPIRNQHVQNRSMQVLFPDGRTISVVGHLHGTRQIYQLYDFVASGEIKTMTDSKFMDLLRMINQENKESYQSWITRQNKIKLVKYFSDNYNLDLTKMIQPNQGLNISEMSVQSHAFEDFEFIKSEISDHSKVQFIGFEGTQDTLNNNLELFIKTRKELLKQFSTRKLKQKFKINKNDIEHILLTSSNGNTYFYMINPKFKHKINFIGMEDENIIELKNGAKPLEEMNIAYNNLILADDNYWKSKNEKTNDSFKSDQSYLHFSTLLIFAYNELNSMNIFSVNDFQVLMQKLRDTCPPRLSDLLEILILKFEQRFRLNHYRDYATAKNLAQRLETGIHFIGLNHLKNVVLYLEKICSDEVRLKSKLDEKTNLSIR